MSDTTFMNDDCWISIIQLQQSYNNYLMTMQNDLTECFGFIGQPEADMLNDCFQVMYAIIKRRRDRHEALLASAGKKPARNERLLAEPGCKADIVDVSAGNNEAPQ